MGYYLRVLGIKDPNIHLDELINSLKSDGLTAKIAYNKDERPDNWTMLEITDSNGKTLAQVERNVVIDGELGKEEMEEFKDNIVDDQPLSAVYWLQNYFTTIKVIYAFQILNEGFKNNNLEIINSIRSKIWNSTGGILQSDNEGFTNEEGYHILWQFDDSVNGKWSCAILNNEGQWQSFVMDLGNNSQRQDFKNGIVPLTLLF